MNLNQVKSFLLDLLLSSMNLNQIILFSQTSISSLIFFFRKNDSSLFVGKSYGNFNAKSEICSRDYLVCKLGIMKKEKCPFGLIFDPITEQCTYPHIVNACLKLVVL